MRPTLEVYRNEILNFISKAVLEMEIENGLTTTTPMSTTTTSMATIEENIHLGKVF